MNQTTIKLYGGTYHGQIAPFEPGTKRIRTPAIYTPGSQIGDSRFNSPDVGAPRADRYRVQYFSQRAMQPMRMKCLYIGLLDGLDGFLAIEEFNLYAEFDRLPWEFPAVSFLKNYDDWFAQCVYRNTGITTWKGIPADWSFP